MPGHTKILSVPYFTQPTGITCQSTCLKMFAPYLEARLRQTTGAADRRIEDIWTDINKGTKRPVQARNARANMKWWLESHFPRVKFENHLPYQSTPDFSLVVHDPYGRFDPSLTEREFGARRWVGGMSLMAGSEHGPGAFNRLELDAVSRRRAGDSRRGTFYLLAAKAA